MSVGFVAAGASIVSSVIGSRASKKAASAQAQAAADAQQLQREQYDQTREDNAPYRERGNAAGNRLNELMGLSAAPSSLKVDENDDLWRRIVTDYEQRHREKFGTDPTRDFTAGADERTLRKNMEDLYWQGKRSMGQGPEMAEKSPEFGSLLRKFTMADRDADPVYQSGLEFGLSEGRRAVDNRFAAAGSSLSGAALKALTRFGNDYASTKAGESRNRFVQDQDATYNRLAGVAGAGQTATRDVSNAGANYASAAGNAIMGGGEARAAGYLGQANSINNGISTGYGMYQGNQLMDLIRQGGSRKAGWGSSGGWTGGGRTVPDYPGAEY